MPQEEIVKEFMELREAEAQIHSITPCNEKWEFYYDETGNCRKFRLKEDGSFNSNDALSHYFILGGLVFDSKKDAQESNPQSLINSLGLQRNIKELKSHLLCPTNWDFEHFIKQDKVTKVIEWIYNSKANIHYSIANNLYYALVDIIDSLNKPQMGEFLFVLKDALYRIAKKHIDFFAEFLSRYGYPDITRTANFWKELSSILADISYRDSLFSDDSAANILATMVADNARHPLMQENILITDNTKYVLHESYLPFYERPCYTFLHSHHNFDEEKFIMRQMSDFPFNNYCFLNSVNEPLIQLSDCFVSILSKILFFFESKTVFEIKTYSDSMDSISKQNFKRIHSLINRSEQKHIFLIHNINAISVIEDQHQKWNIIIN